MPLVIAVLLFSLSFYSRAQTTNPNELMLQNLKTIKRISFGSCNDQNDPQPLWKDLIQQKPDIFIWGGDAIYADWGKSKSIERAYQKQLANPDYQTFKSQTPIIGTWDDHDYAYNNADGELGIKKESQKLFLNFLDTPEESSRRTQEGVYTSYEFGEGNQKIKFILLDNRYFKGLDPKAPLLGETQWQWLENELKNTTASLHFISAGLPIFGPLIRYTEEWGEYPVEHQRMRALLKTYQPKGAVFLTGDKHFSSIYKYWGQLEFMSSGMTHTADRRIWWYLGRKYPTTFFGLSYGQIDIGWEGDTPLLTLMMRNTQGKEIHKTKVRWKKGSWSFAE